MYRQRNQRQFMSNLIHRRLRSNENHHWTINNPVSRQSNDVSTDRKEVQQNQSLVNVLTGNQISQKPEEVNLQTSQRPIQFGGMMSQFPEMNQRLFQGRVYHRGNETLDHRELVHQSVTRRNSYVPFPWSDIRQQMFVCQTESIGMFKTKLRLLDYRSNHNGEKRLVLNAHHISLCTRDNVIVNRELNLQYENIASIGISQSIASKTEKKLSKKRISTIKLRIFPEAGLQGHFTVFSNVVQLHLLRPCRKWPVTQTVKQQVLSNYFGHPIQRQPWLDMVRMNGVSLQSVLTAKLRGLLRTERCSSQILKLFPANYIYLPKLLNVLNGHFIARDC